jgi:hypothetical protein
MIKEIRNLYNKRSRFAHSGFIENLTTNDYSLINSTVRSVIEKLIELNKNRQISHIARESKYLADQSF